LYHPNETIKTFENNHQVSLKQYKQRVSSIEAPHSVAEELSWEMGCPRSKVEYRDFKKRNPKRKTWWAWM